MRARKPKQELVTTLAMDMGTRRRIDAFRFAEAERRGGLPEPMCKVVVDAVVEYLDRRMSQVQ